MWLLYGFGASQASAYGPAGINPARVIREILA
jgi:hypothetical protein